MAMIGATAIWKVATGTKKAIDFLQSFNGVEEEGYVLWKTLESLSIPVSVADKLLVREEALVVLLPSTRLIKFQIGKVEEILEIGTAEHEDEDERPDSKESWGKWLRSKKDGKERRERIAEMLPKLNAVISMLSLGLQTLAVQPEVLRRVQPGAPMCFVPAAYAKAQRLLEEVLFGRVTSLGLCCGQWWQREVKSAAKKTVLVCKGPATVCLSKDAKSKNLQLSIAAAPPQDEDDEHDDWPSQIFDLIGGPSSKSSSSSSAGPTTVERRRGGGGTRMTTSTEDNEVNRPEGDIIYQISTQAEGTSSSSTLSPTGAVLKGFLEFELDYDNAVSAEVFELIVGLAIHTDSLRNDFPNETGGKFARETMPKIGFPYDFRQDDALRLQVQDLENGIANLNL
ncbi:unnamed protein product [Amoebophrya sp. A25]|nr:unnamed protein product [Amoebophrya sp. A25]|eukprot:GSA25T00001456001.1